jgi:hypothetical protein
MEQSSCIRRLCWLGYSTILTSSRAGGQKPNSTVAYWVRVTLPRRCRCVESSAGLVDGLVGVFESVPYVDGLGGEIQCLEYRKGVWGTVLGVLRLGDLEKRRRVSLGRESGR